MKMIALAGALCLLFSSSTFCKANSGPWCAPNGVVLTFKNRQDRDLARIEFHSLNTICDRNPEKSGFGMRFERSMRIEHNGQWTEVPKACVSGVSFGLDGLTLSGDDAGLGISLVGKSTDGDEDVKVMIYKLPDKVACFRVEPCSNVENRNHEIQECYRKLIP